MAVEASALINKVGQLIVVTVGFFATTCILLWQAVYNDVSVGRLAVTFLAALGLALRYWWVILLLEWPFRLIRTMLLLLIWSLMGVAASTAQTDHAWVLALAALCGIGAVTEFYNLATKQWKVEFPSLARALKRDHVAGGITALFAAILLAGLSAWSPRYRTLWIMALVLGDWARMIWLVTSYRKLLHGN